MTSVCFFRLTKILFLTFIIQIWHLSSSDKTFKPLLPDTVNWLYWFLIHLFLISKRRQSSVYLENYQMWSLYKYQTLKTIELVNVLRLSTIIWLFKCYEFGQYSLLNNVRGRLLVPEMNRFSLPTEIFRLQVPLNGLSVELFFHLYSKNADVSLKVCL